MTSPNPGFVQRTLNGHAAIGLLSAVLMYLLILSGTLAVFDDELHRWEQPRSVETQALAPNAVQTALMESLESTAGRPSPAIVIHLPSDASPRATLSDATGLHYLDASGHRRSAVQTPWTDFVMALHFYLNLPEVWGLALVGALGVMLVSLSITGVLALPRIFRDAFRFNPRASRQLAHVDWHNRLSVWTLPFGIAVAFSGAVLGVMTPGAAMMSKFHLAPSEAAVFAPVFGYAPAPEGTSNRVPDAAAALQVMTSRFAQAVPTDVIVRNAGTASQDIEVLTREPQRLIVGEYYLFDARGEFIRPVGLSEGHVGQQFAASMYRLHFGNFAGLAMKLAYFVFGIALTVVSATGVSIWLMKRRRRGLGLPRLEQMWAAVVWGSPLLLGLAFCGKLVGAREATMTAFFWAGLALALVASACTNIGAATLGRALRIVLAATLLLIGIGHASLAEWSRAGILSIDAGLILTAAALAIVDVGVTRLGSGLRNRPGSASGSSLPTQKAA
jgi:uncharacterized iron-regulated membrane protein